MKSIAVQYLKELLNLLHFNKLTEMKLSKDLIKKELSNLRIGAISETYKLKKRRISLPVTKLFTTLNSLIVLPKTPQNKAGALFLIQPRQ